MTTTLIHCAAATANTTSNERHKDDDDQRNGRGLLASKDSRTRIKVVNVASHYGGRKSVRWYSMQCA